MLIFDLQDFKIFEFNTSPWKRVIMKSYNLKSDQMMHIHCLKIELIQFFIKDKTLIIFFYVFSTGYRPSIRIRNNFIYHIDIESMSHYKIWLE